MGFDTHASPDDRLDLAPAVEFSPRTVSIVWPRETSREMECEAGVLANHQAREEKARVAEKEDAVKWECTLIVAEAGKIWPKTFRLTELPEREDQFIAFSLDGYAARVLLAAESIRTMELHPV